MSNIEKAVSFMIDIAKDDSHGYDQIHRTGGTDYDCSSLVGTALNQAGFNVKKSSTTRTLRAQLLACGFKTVSVGGARKRGDIFLKEGHHVVMCTGTNNIVHASINEKGKTTGGKPGDQTGKEICVRSFYNYKGGWDYHFRFSDAISTQPATKPSATPKNDLVALGQQHTINYTGHSITVDGINGRNTKANIVRCFQVAMNHDYGSRLKVDGACGKNTINALGKHYVKHGETQEMVRAVQVALYCYGFNPGNTDAIFGDNTKLAVIQFQRAKGLTADGIAGKNTIKALMGI
jgi:hypothetical protein|nr:MAG TPA: lysozyme family protein [Caudoviricetes sp.]